jgi:hypothetical protein
MSQRFLINHSSGKCKNHPRSKASATKTAEIVLRKLNLQNAVTLNESKQFYGDGWTCKVEVTDMSISVEIVFELSVVDVTKSVSEGGFGFYPFLRIF